jgi:hypothetical protein
MIEKSKDRRIYERERREEGISRKFTGWRDIEKGRL